METKHIYLSSEEITDTEFAVALQFAKQYIQKLELPMTSHSMKSQFIESMTVAFCNGVSFVRKWEKLTDDERKDVEKYFAPLAQKLLNKNYN